ncbi:MAG: CCA tRNA nucleotidyltransferase [Chlamydiales bacterium]
MQSPRYKSATYIVQTLFDAGFTAYFAGGWVRDYLLDRECDDIDIATSAAPEQVEALFAKTIPLGIAFGMIVVVMEGVNFEVTTFRKDHPYHDGRHPDGVDFTSAKKDAQRRDFTINGMFYDPLTEDIYDYVGGKEDLKKRIIRAIGDPHLRFQEDRLRMVRAVRYATRLGFRIEEKTVEGIKKWAPSLFPSVSMERIWQEFNKMLPERLDMAVVMLMRFGLLSTIFPDLHSLKHVEERVASFAKFPKNCPTILYLLELFPFYTREQKCELCDYLKSSNQDKKLAQFISQTPQDLCDWAHFYADPRKEVCLKVLAASGKLSLTEHDEQERLLKPHIERIQKGKPLVDSAILRTFGIDPGPNMGELLRKATRLAINENLQTKEAVLARLFEQKES